jgi:hypothetical protein
MTSNIKDVATILITFYIGNILCIKESIVLQAPPSACDIGIPKIDVATEPHASKIAFRPNPDNKGPQTVEIAGFIKIPSQQCHPPLIQDHTTDRLPIPIPITSTHVVIASAALQMTFIYQLR